MKSKTKPISFFEQLFRNGVIAIYSYALPTYSFILAGWKKPTRILNFMERRRIAPPQPSWMVQRRLQKNKDNLLYGIFGASELRILSCLFCFPPRFMLVKLKN